MQKAVVVVMAMVMAVIIIEVRNKVTTKMGRKCGMGRGSARESLVESVVELGGPQPPERLRKACALALLMVTDRLWSISCRTLSLSLPSRMAAAEASCFQTAKDSGAQAPVVSATIGMKVTPAASHSACVFANERLVEQYSVAAASAFDAARSTIPCRCGAVMAKSSAAGKPWVQVGR